MKVDYLIMEAFLGAGYLVLVNYLPDFPLAQSVVVGLAVYVASKLGVEIVGKPIKAVFARVVRSLRGG